MLPEALQYGYLLFGLVNGQGLDKLHACRQQGIL